MSLSINELLALGERHPEPLLGFFVALPVLALGLGMLPVRGRRERSAQRYVYSALVYAATIPGVISAVLVAYALFFIHQNLLEVNALVYFVPLVSMVLTLVFIGRKVSFNALPGFDRLSGLIVVVAVTFTIVFALFTTRIFIGFFGSMDYLIVVAIVLFLLLKWGARKVAK